VFERKDAGAIAPELAPSTACGTNLTRNGRDPAQELDILTASSAGLKMEGE